MTTIITGRFAPLLNSQLALMRAAAAGSGEVIVAITGAEASSQSRFPWTAEERETMIRTALGEAAGRVSFRHSDDNPYLGRRQDCPTRDQEEAICAAYFAGDDDKVEAAVPASVFEAMQAFRASPDYDRLSEEARYIAKYRADWIDAPWPPTFITVDTFITCADHLLLIKRGGLPGKGLWALPGGFVEQKEWVKDAALRELREETGLVLTDDEIKACLKAQAVFDDPYRSARGRTVTHGFHFDLSGQPPNVEGADDAQDARWWPLVELSALHGQYLEDHGQIIEYFLGGGAN